MKKFVSFVLVLCLLFGTFCISALAVEPAEPELSTTANVVTGFVSSTGGVYLRNLPTTAEKVDGEYTQLGQLTYGTTFTWHATVPGSGLSWYFVTITSGPHTGTQGYICKDYCYLVSGHESIEPTPEIS